MAATKNAAAKFKQLTDERSKQMTLYNRMPDKRDNAAKTIVNRIQKIDEQIETLQQDSIKSGTPIWVWFLVALLAGAIAWAGAYFASISV